MFLQKITNHVHLKITIHEKIKYSHLSKTQAISVSCASDTMKIQIKLLSHKTCNYVILEYFLR